MKCQPIKLIQPKVTFLRKLNNNAPTESKFTVIPEPQKDIFKKSEDNTDKKGI